MRTGTPLTTTPSRLARTRHSSLRAPRLRRRAERSARSTSSVESLTAAITRASATGITGGESMMILS